MAKRQRKSAVGRRPTRKERQPDSRRSGQHFELDVVPGLRDRLVAEMEDARISEQGRLHYLCSLTGRAPQTVRRWIDADRPGLPDLMSFASLCMAFDTDANWMLGLTKIRYALPKVPTVSIEDDALHSGEAGTSWVDYVLAQVIEASQGCETHYMQGDEMEPRIRDGAPMLVDTSIRQIGGNGIYMVEFQGRTLVRNIENRIGDGLVLSCENPRYQASIIKNAGTATKTGLKVIGRVRFSIGVERL